MQVPLQVTFHGVEHSDAVERYVRRRAAKLDGAMERIVACRIALEHPHRSARHGDQYRVRVDVRIPGGEVVFASADRGDGGSADLYAAIDAALEGARRRIKELRSRSRARVRSAKARRPA